MAAFDYNCPKCGKKETKQGLGGSTCLACNISMSLVPFRMQISTPGEKSKEKDSQDNAWEQHANAEFKKKNDDQAALQKTEEHWNREWHRAELHGPNDGGEALKEEMAQTR